MNFWIVAILATLAYAVVSTVLDRRRPPPKAQAPSGRATGDPEQIARRVVEMAAPSLRLLPAQDLGFSKMGGDPDLPTGVEWPQGAEGPFGFLLQIDLAEAHRHGGPDWLPPSGALYAFRDDRWGYADQVRILHAPDGERAPRSPPADVPRTWRHPQRPVTLAPETSLPSLLWLGEEVVGLDPQHPAWSLIPDLPCAPGPRHQLGGYPDEIQDEWLPMVCEFESRGLSYRHGQHIPPGLEEASESWRLLLQIDSDDRLKMNWGGGGMLYVFVREEDARSGDFSRTVARPHFC